MNKKRYLATILVLLFVIVSCDNTTESNTVEGCLDLLACNYNPDATENDGSCEYAQENFDCEGNCLINIDACGICGGNAIYESDCGCIDEIACNYEPLALVDDGSCEYAQEYYNCSGDCLNDDDNDGLCNEFEPVLPYDVGENIKPLHQNMNFSICYGSDNDSLKISDLSGKVILLNLAASW